jgi:superfamily II DNA or RNA helicase
MTAATAVQFQAQATARMQPRLRMFTELLSVESGRGFDEVQAPVLSLSFRYPGAVLRPGDEGEHFFSADAGGVRRLARDLRAEREACRLLESLGAVDLRCLPSHGAPPDSLADFVVRVEGDVHAHCAFTDRAVPQLRASGWDVAIDESYPFRVLERELAWYAEVTPEGERPDWFGLELGVELGGRRVNLLPVLLELLDSPGACSDLKGLASTAPRFVQLPMEGGPYLRVPTEQLEVLLAVTVELYEGGIYAGQRLCFAAGRLGALDALERDFAKRGLTLCLEGGDEARARARTLRQVPRALALPLAGLQASLRPYQEDGLRWLQHLRAEEAGGILADDMGLGKTLQTIAHLECEARGGRLDRPALIVAPTSLTTNWVRELGRFAPTLRVLRLYGEERHARWAALDAHDVAVTSYPILVRDRERFEQHGYHYVILDEAQTIKNPRSLASQAARALSARHRLCLTGTPIENNLSELWALFDFAEPGLLGEEDQFRHGYQLPIEKDGDAARLQALRNRVGPHVLRRMKQEVARDLPPKTELVRPVELVGRQRQLYESIRAAAHGKVRKVIAKRGLSASTVAILDALMKLRQVCCDPRLVQMEAARGCAQSAKYDMLFELLDTQLDEGRRILIFSQFTSMLALISQGLAERSVAHAVLTGETRDRQRQVDAFEAGKADVFLISLKAGGTGLNLTSADTVIHYDPWWNPAAQAQATDRAYRIGQTRPVFAYNLIAAGSVEERILRLQERKRKLAEGVLGGGSGAGASLSEADVEQLFAPLPGGG